MQLKSVDLPAPFGPIRPVIEPGSTSSVAPSTARTPPKRAHDLVDLERARSLEHHLVALAEDPLRPQERRGR